MQILASHGQRVGQRHRVVNIHRGRNVAHRLAFEHAFEQVLDRAARAFLGLEQTIGLAPCLDRCVLADSVAGQMTLRIDIGAVEQRRNRIHVLLRNLSRGLHALHDHNTDRCLRKQLPE